uniref:NADP-dependent oxidoreductase domain-containing protein n=1 Tax=Aegilops tauschii subsp. strangulata TaxID=200361 RepID=A0A452ZTT7_AEGTS
MGFGTWAWGNQLLWGYQEIMDSELQECFNLALKNGINLFDTADSYGTGKLNGQSERLLGKFIRKCQGKFGEVLVFYFYCRVRAHSCWRWQMNRRETSKLERRKSKNKSEK